MPSWVMILLQVVEAIIQSFVTHPPSVEGQEQHTNDLIKLNKIRTILLSEQ